MHDGAPPTVVIDGAELAGAKRRIMEGDNTLTTALDKLISQADGWLTRGPWSVTSKSKLAPSGNKHDYASQAIYWWPNPDTADGLPYVERDGHVNPGINDYPDRMAVENVFASTYLLSLAWYYTNDAKYAHHAAHILRTWFIEPQTAMAPHLEHAQLIPGLNTGQGTGIIDFSCDYTNVLDAAAILSTGAPGWTAVDHEAFVDWNKKFLHWLVHSDKGHEALSRPNNHATFAKMQIAALALFTGDNELAATTTDSVKAIIDEQIAKDGSQPLEANRSCSWHYCNFNLVALLRAGLTGQKVHVDLFSYKGPVGQSILKAVEFLVPAAVDGEQAWPHKDTIFKPYAATDNVQAAARAGSTISQAVEALPAPPGGDLFALRPAPQQLHSATASSHLTKNLN